MHRSQAIAPTSLRCPIPSALSPHVEAAQQWLTRWLERHLPTLAAETRRRVDRAGYARYAARLYPEADQGTLQTLSGMFTWFFLLDDAADATTAPDTRHLRALFAEAMDVLRSGAEPKAHTDHKPRTEPTVVRTEPLHRLLDDVWHHPQATMPPHWRDRFVDSVHQHLSGAIDEAEAKAAGRRPGVTEYVELRRATSATYVAHVLTEYAAGAPLPDSVHGHPAVRAYSTAANDLVSWFNDLLSLDRDEATAGGHNLVLALATERGLSTSAAVEEAVAMWRDRMDSFASLRAAVPSFGPALAESVRHYLLGVERSVRGTIDWSLESVRYRPPRLVADYLSC